MVSGTDQHEVRALQRKAIAAEPLPYRWGWYAAPYIHPWLWRSYHAGNAAAVLRAVASPAAAAAVAVPYFISGTAVAAVLGYCGLLLGIGVPGVYFMAVSVSCLILVAVDMLVNAIKSKARTKTSDLAREQRKVAQLPEGVRVGRVHTDPGVWGYKVENSGASGIPQFIEVTLPDPPTRETSAEYQRRRYGPCVHPTPVVPTPNEYNARMKQLKAAGWKLRSSELTMQPGLSCWRCGAQDVVLMKQDALCPPCHAENSGRARGLVRYKWEWGRR